MYLDLLQPSTSPGLGQLPFHVTPRPKGGPRFRGFADYQPQSFVTPQVLVDPYNSSAILIPDGWGGAKAFALPPGLGRGVQGLGQAGPQPTTPCNGTWVNPSNQPGAWTCWPAGTPLPPSSAINNAITGGGQAGCFAGGFANNMSQWLAGLSAESPADAAVGCGNGGQPCASPADFATMAAKIAASWCQESNDQAQFGCPSDPNCVDMGVAASAPYAAEALSLAKSFPASVWATEAANAASGNYYGAQDTYGAPKCPAGTFYNTVPGGGFTCSAPDAAPQYLADQGPAIDIATGQPIAGTSSTSSSSTASGSNNSSSTAPNGTTTAVLTNLTAPGGQLEVGDQWQLVITGPANSSVTGSSTQNGGAPSTNNFGSTDGSGRLTLGGNFGAGDAGSWLETWTVAGAKPAQVSFVVAQAGNSNPAAGTSNSTSGGGSSSSTGSSTTGSGVDLSFLTNPVSIMGQSFPVWGLAAAALVAFMVVKK